MRKTKVFLAAPFQNVMNSAEKKMNNEDVTSLSRLIQFLEKNGCEVHNAHLREKWGEEWMHPDVCTKIDYDEISKADILIAFPGKYPSGGVHIELGWASALGKRIILLLEKSNGYSNLVIGLKKVANVEYIYYSNEAEYYEKLIELLHKPTNTCA